MKSKFIVLTTLLAVAVLLPVSYVTADLYFDMTLVSEKADGTGSFTGLNGASGLALFTNDTTNGSATTLAQYAVVTGFLDDAITLIDVTDPLNPTVIDTMGTQTTGEESGIYMAHDGARNISLFVNDSDTSDYTCTTVRCEVTGIVTNFQTDSISLLNFSAPGERIYFISNYTEQVGTTPKLGQAGNVFANYEQEVLAVGSAEHLSALDGPWDVATWFNVTSSGESNPYAIVTGFNSDGVTIFNLTNPSSPFVSQNLTDGGGGQTTTNRPNLEFDGPTGVETFYIPQDGTGNNPIPYAIITAFLDDGFQILNLSDPDFNFEDDADDEAPHKQGYPPVVTADVAAGPGSAGGIRAAGIHSNATDGDDGFELLQGAIDVAVWNTTATNHYAIIVAMDDNAFTILDISDPTAKIFEKQLANGSGAYGNNWNITSPTAVSVFEGDDDHFIAAIATNQTSGASGSISLIDLYVPSNPQPLATVVSDGIIASDGIPIALIADAQSIETFYLAGVYYAAITSYGDDAITIIQLNGDRQRGGGASRSCGDN